MKKLVSLMMAAAMWLMGCSATGNALDNACKVRLYKNRQSSETQQQNVQELEALVKELVEGTDDAYKQIVTAQDIKELKQQLCLEIIFPSELAIALNGGICITMSKILIPLDEHHDNSIVFYCGHDRYFSPPYVNSHGARTLEKILQCVTTMP